MSTVPQSVQNAGEASLAYRLTLNANRNAKGVRSAMLSAPGLRIVGGAGSALAEAQTAFYALAGGTLVLGAAGVDMPALSGTVTNAQFGIYAWSINAAGTITQATLATGATLGAITFPTIPADEALIGFVIVNPTGAGNFVGGTTTLDSAGVVPNAVFINGNNIGTCNPAADVISFKGVGVPA